VKTSLSENPNERAIYASTDELSDYELKEVKVVFNPPTLVPGNGVNRNQLRSVIQLSYNVEIPIFDNLKFDTKIKSFTVRLFADPEAVSGSVIPIPYDPLEPTDQYVLIDEATVYLWDEDVQKFADYTTCNLDDGFFATGQNLQISSIQSVGVKCMQCVSDNVELGCTSLIPYTPSSVIQSAISITTSVNGIFQGLEKTDWSASGSFPNGYLPVSFRTPWIGVASFTVQVQMVYQGILASHYLYSALVSDGKRGDIQRLERLVDYEWERMQIGPSALEISGYLHFGCTSTAIPTQLGFVVSQGGAVSMSLNTVAVNIGQPVRGISDPAYWQAQTDVAGLPCATSSSDGVLCYTPSSAFSANDIFVLNVNFQASPLYPERPAGIRFLMKTLDAGASSATWKVLPSECLLAGMDVGGSPMRSLTTASR